ncbi:MAG: amino acid ABC transporter permease [Chloroflexi bacterium]|nr:amino acid ABC transporter permease [Chloroflexota bacterium]
MVTRVVVQRSPALRARRWARSNLFSNAWNALLTLVTLALIGFVAFVLVRFIFIEADWSVVRENRRLIFLGRFPQEHEARIWPPIWLFALLAGGSMGLWGRVNARGAAAIVVSVVLVFALLAHGANGARLGVAVVLAGGAYLLAERGLRGEAAQVRARRAAIAGWALLLPFAVVVLVAFGGAQTSRLGGFLLNILLATVAIEAALPLGVLLALGRASSLPVVRVVTTAYIETVRGAPLIAWLFVAWFVLPDVLPPVFNLDRIDLVLRAMVMLSLFTGAYIAEIVRGGLQSVAPGQVEAAKAVGLGGFDITARIVVPQALRAVIPALVSQLISLWKDTTLVSILGLTDGLGGSEAAVSQREFFGRQREVLLFAAGVFWVVAYAMSRLSLRLERSLGVGER